MLINLANAGACDKNPFCDEKLYKEAVGIYQKQTKKGIKYNNSSIEKQNRILVEDYRKFHGNKPVSKNDIAFQQIYEARERCLKSSQKAFRDTMCKLYAEQVFTYMGTQGIKPKKKKSK